MGSYVYSLVFRQSETAPLVRAPVGRLFAQMHTQGDHAREEAVSDCVCSNGGG